MTDKNWENNAIQFPRLLAEINACGLSDGQMQAIAESMDLDYADVQELLDRAEDVWDRMKEKELGEQP